MNGKNGLADLICLPRRLLLSIDWNSWSWGKQRNWIVKIPMSSNIRKIFKYHWLPKPLLCSTLETICVIFMIIPNIFTWYIEVYFKRFILCHVLFLLRVYLYILWLFTNFNCLFFSDSINVWRFLKCKFQGLLSEYLLISLSFVVQMTCE